MQGLHCPSQYQYIGTGLHQMVQRVVGTTKLTVNLRWRGCREHLLRSRGAKFIFGNRQEYTHLLKLLPCHNDIV